jgi:hypothetical protein
MMMPQILENNHLQKLIKDIGMVKAYLFYKIWLWLVYK